MFSLIWRIWISTVEGRRVPERNGGVDKNEEILTISKETILVSNIKQRCQNRVIEGYSEQNQQQEIELKSLRLVWEHKDRLPDRFPKEEAGKKTSGDPAKSKGEAGT